MDTENDDVSKILSLLKEISCNVSDRDTSNEGKHFWISKQEVMVFLGFKYTHMRKMESTYHLVSTMIGKEKYYQTASLLKAFHDNRNN